MELIGWTYSTNKLMLTNINYFFSVNFLLDKFMLYTKLKIDVEICGHESGCIYHQNVRKTAFIATRYNRDWS